MKYHFVFLNSCSEENIFYRFLGVGAMLIGGMFALVSLRKALWKGIEAGVKVSNNHGGALEAS